MSRWPATFLLVTFSRTAPEAAAHHCSFAVQEEQEKAPETARDMLFKAKRASLRERESPALLGSRERESPASLGSFSQLGGLLGDVAARPVLVPAEPSAAAVRRPRGQKGDRACKSERGKKLFKAATAGDGRQLM